MNDRQLRKDVLDELEFDPSINAADIAVAVNDGVVTLSGDVTSFGQKIAAERAARRIKGVRALVEKIQVRIPSECMVSDDEIAKRALEVLKWNSMLPAGAIKPTVNNGWITLTGEVEWQYQRSAAEDALRPLPGVVAVINDLTVKPKVRVTDVKHRIEEALKRSAEVEAGRISVAVTDGGTVTLDGRVRDWQERMAVKNAAWSAPGVQHVHDQLTLG